MNFVKDILAKKNVNTRKDAKGYYIENTSNKTGAIFFKNVYLKKAGKSYFVHLDTELLEGKAPELKILNRKFKTILSVNANEETYFDFPANCGFVAIKVEQNSKFYIKNFVIEENKNPNYIKDSFSSDVLVICPGYPSVSNKYLYGFVHTRMVEYKKNNIKFDIAYTAPINYFSKYEFEGIKVNKINFFELRTLLQEKKYKKILIHYFSKEFQQIMDATDLSETDLYLFYHGGDIAYRDSNILNGIYFYPNGPITPQQEEDFKKTDRIISKYNDLPNVKMIFGTNWIKNHAEKLNGIKYKNYDIIPTFIDGETFKECSGKGNQNNKIYVLRKFDNYNTYSVDIDVLTILELSRRPFFKELEFDIYGDGYLHDALLEPLAKFDNVHIHQKFLTHQEISEIQNNHGIALFATRYETMGVSAAEAALAGCAVVTNSVAAVKEVFEDSRLLCPQDDYMLMADKIEKLYKDKTFYENERKYQQELIAKKYNLKETILKEIELIKNDNQKEIIDIEEISDKPILTIAVASYNVEKYLKNSIYSLLRAKRAKDLEVLIVNDGSKDNTAKIGKELEKLTTKDGKSIVKLIDKENGGHGSAINKGIECATGKYFKLMDGDDYFDTDELDKLIDILEKEDSDLVLNNYVEDKSVECMRIPIRHYEFMIPGVQYHIEDMCQNHYGFTQWGPLLSTTTFRTDMLKKAGFKISEKCFYVDMELNSFAFAAANSVVYYPLDIYIYYLGRVGQSVSAASFKRNYKNHEHVTLRIIKDVYYGLELSDIKKQYLLDKIVLPLINGQYYITTEYFTSGKEFSSFNTKLKKYPELYYNDAAIASNLKKYRLCNGRLFKLIKFLVKIKSLLKRK